MKSRPSLDMEGLVDILFREEGKTLEDLVFIPREDGDSSWDDREAFLKEVGPHLLRAMAACGKRGLPYTFAVEHSRSRHKDAEGEDQDEAFIFSAGAAPEYSQPIFKDFSNILSSGFRAVPEPVFDHFLRSLENSLAGRLRDGIENPDSDDPLWNAKGMQA